MHRLTIFYFLVIPMHAFYRSIIVIVTLAISAIAHPEVAASVMIHAIFDENGFKGVQNHWEYEEEYSEGTFALVDNNKDGKLSGAELEELKTVLFGEIKDKNFHNYVLLKTKFLQAKGFKDFKAKMQNGQLVVDFLLQYDVPAKSDYTILTIVVADPSNYILLSTNMEKSGITAPKGIEVEYFNDKLDGLTMMDAFQSNVEGLFLRFKK